MAFKTTKGKRMNPRRRAKLKRQAVQRIETREANVRAGLKGVQRTSHTPTPAGRMRVKLGKMATSINSTDFTPTERIKSRGEMKPHEKTYKRFSSKN